MLTGGPGPRAGAKTAKTSPPDLGGPRLKSPGELQKKSLRKIVQGGNFIRKENVPIQKLIVREKCSKGRGNGCKNQVSTLKWGGKNVRGNGRVIFSFKFKQSGQRKGQGEVVANGPSVAKKMPHERGFSRLTKTGGGGTTPGTGKDNTPQTGGVVQIRERLGI